MIIYIPEGKHQKEDKIISLWVDEYKDWLLNRGNVIRILPIRRSDSDGNKYEPLVEIYNKEGLVNYHCIGASMDEREALNEWFGSLYQRKDGYINLKMKAKSERKPMRRRTKK